MEKISTARLDRLNPPLVVNVVHDKESGMWVGSCDALFLATEAETFESLQERVWDVVPDCVSVNGFPFDSDNLHLKFVVEQDATSKAIAL